MNTKPSLVIAQNTLLSGFRIVYHMLSHHAIGNGGHIRISSSLKPRVACLPTRRTDVTAFHGMAERLGWEGEAYDGTAF